jgi:hypothetical protein
MTKNTLPSLDGLSPEDMYFKLQAYLGTTKHMGGFDTTKTLINLCHISQHTGVLDVGCGVGACPRDFFDYFGYGLTVGKR